MYLGFDTFTEFAGSFITSGMALGFGFYCLGYGLSPSKFISRIS